MTNEVFLDTAYAIALSVESDEHHERAEELDEHLEAEATRLVTTRAVLLKIENALLNKRCRKDALELSDALEQAPLVEIVSFGRTLRTRVEFVPKVTKYRFGLDLLNKFFEKCSGMFSKLILKGSCNKCAE